MYCSCGHKTVDPLIRVARLQARNNNLRLTLGSVKGILKTLKSL